MQNVSTPTPPSPFVVHSPRLFSYAICILDVFPTTAFAGIGTAVRTFLPGLLRPEGELALLEEAGLARGAGITAPLLVTRAIPVVGGGAATSRLR